MKRQKKKENVDMTTVNDIVFRFLCVAHSYRNISTRECFQDEKKKVPYSVPGWIFFQIIFVLFSSLFFSYSLSPFHRHQHQYQPTEFFFNYGTIEEKKTNWTKIQFMLFYQSPFCFWYLTIFIVQIESAHKCIHFFPLTHRHIRWKLILQKHTKYANQIGNGISKLKSIRVKMREREKGNKKIYVRIELSCSSCMWKCLVYHSILVWTEHSEWSITLYT